MRSVVFAMMLALCLPMSAAFAVEPGEALADPALERRARAISAELRCLVCQNQSIDDSNAPLARDLRLLVRERLKAGDDDGRVLDYIVARYGEFVLLRPPLGASTLLLWATPLLLLLLAVMAAGRLLMSRASEAAGAPVPLSPEEEARLARVLEARDEGGPPGGDRSSGSR